MYDASCQHVLFAHKFTGKERDPESGNDYFGARYYGSSMGRFMTPDWSGKPQGVPYAEFGDPQSLNLYEYVRNNPLAKVDADGHLGCGFLWLGTCPQAPPPPPPTPPAAPSNPVFPTVDQAAAAGARVDQQQQKKTGAENASSEYEIGPAYTYTDPVTQGQKNTVDPNNTSGVSKTKTVDLGNPPIPPGTQLVAESHSHSNTLGFSGEDVQRAHDETILGYGHPLFQGEYVGQPDGSVIKYDDKTGQQTYFAPGEPQ